MTASATRVVSGKGGGDGRPVRSRASHAPKWQRFQAHLASASAKSQSASDRAKPSGKASSPSSVRSSQQEIALYQRQYSHVYTERLGALKDRCREALDALEDSGDGGDGNGNGESFCKNVDRILELKEDEPSKVVGTIVVEGTNGGNGGNNFYHNYDDDGEAGEDRQLHPRAVCRTGDQLFLEDESGRVAIRFVEGGGEKTSGSAERNPEARKSGSRSKSHHSYEYCTGVVVGVRGVVDDRGMMHVDAVVEPAPVPPRVAKSDRESDEKIDENAGPSYLLLVSSLLCGDPGVSSLPREMLVSFLQGHLGSEAIAEKASGVARVIVAGSGPGAVDPAMGLREFDLWGLQVTRTAGIPADVMPSEGDPTTRNWPQRPLHSSLLPHTLGGGGGAGTPMARTTPNPYEASIGNQLVLGTDGLNVRDLQKHVLRAPPATAAGESESPHASPRLLTELEALEQTLRWAHICPTAPSSPAIGMVPSGDPMVMSRRPTPNLYFCGNCEEGFATKLVRYDDSNDKTKTNNSNNNNNKDADPSATPKTRLVCVPKFSETGEAVLVNLKTLEAEVLRFKAGTTQNKTEE